MMLRVKEKDFKETLKLWPRMSRTLTVIRSEKQYKKAVEFLDFLIDTVGSDPRHPLAELLDLMGILIENYEESNVTEPPGDSVAVLRLLMQEHHLTQSDLPKLALKELSQKY